MKVEMDREEAEALIEAARYAVANPDFARHRKADMRSVTMATEKLRAALADQGEEADSG